MMPELYLADALGAAGKPLLRVHTAGSVGGSTAIVAASLVQAGRPRAGADRRLREAVGVQRDVGALGAGAVHHAGARRRGRLLRSARALLHPPVRRTDARRRDRRGEGPAERTEEPLRPPAQRGHHGRVGARLARCSGTRSGTTRRVRPPTAPARWSSRPRTPPRSVPNPAWIHGTQMRSEPTTAAERDQVNPQAGREAAAALWRRPASPARSTRSTAPRSTCRSRGSSRCGWRTSASPPRARAGSSPRPARPPSAATSRST